MDRPYRSRALWMALGGLSIVFLALAASYGTLASAVGGVLTNGAVSFVLITSFWGVAIIGLFGWMITNVNVALAADYFHRDALSWRRGGGLTAFAVAVALYVIDSVGGVGEFGNLLGTAVTIGYLVIIVYEVAATAVAYAKIEDRAVKAYMKWVALSFAGFLVAGALYSYLGPILLPVMVYFMYRASGSLSIRTRMLSS